METQLMFILVFLVCLLLLVLIILIFYAAIDFVYDKVSKEIGGYYFWKRFFSSLITGLIIGIPVGIVALFAQVASRYFTF